MPNAAWKRARTDARSGEPATMAHRSACEAMATSAIAAAAAGTNGSTVTPVEINCCAPSIVKDPRC